MPNYLFIPLALLAAVAAEAQQRPDAELEAPMQVLDAVADLDEVIDEKKASSWWAPAVTASDEEDEDEEGEPEVEERNAFSGLKDDFEHDDVDIYNAPDLDHEDDFEEDEEVDQVEFVD
ncbi:MAG: hypothetical protein WBN23_11960 [Woeseia sp.]